MPALLLRPVGFWTSRRGDGLPDPRQLMSTTWEKQRRLHIASYLATAPILDDLEPHDCLVCGARAGGRERTDGVWRFPEGLAHYVTAHGVKLPGELIEHMAKNNFAAPSVDVEELRESLAPSDPKATKLISKSFVAAALDDMLSPPKNHPNTHALDDPTDAILAQHSWRAIVQGVPTKPNRVLFDRPIVLGRDRTCDVVLQHQSVSRRHVRLVPWRDRVIVQDLDSQNGVWVGEERRHGQLEIKDGEQFSLGQATVIVVRER